MEQLRAMTPEELQQMKMPNQLPVKKTGRDLETTHQIK